jgi:hypothetical protein
MVKSRTWPMSRAAGRLRPCLVSCCFFRRHAEYLTQEGIAAQPRLRQRSSPSVMPFDENGSVVLDSLAGQAK